MAEVDVRPDSESWVRQFIPCDSFTAYYGKYFRLSADVLVKAGVPTSYPFGVLEFGYWHADTVPGDTTWQQVASLGVPTELAAQVGLNKLETSFSLPEPWTVGNRPWQGGYVLMRINASGTQGKAWMDDVELGPCGPTPD
jgi:hypothetical protein